jgi:hypothetical protein|tara:strand:- start:2541 stop:2897 length:357 start_codon:yes stop_codon:yes gene_type:complete
MSVSKVILIKSKKLAAISPKIECYVPGKFICGYLKKIKEGFTLSKGKMIYNEEPKDLLKYQTQLNNNKLNIVRSLLIPDSLLESIANSYKSCNDLKKPDDDLKTQIKNQIESINDYFV